MKSKLVFISIAFLAACSQDPLTISDAENAGFQKGTQQMFQMIGAVDGWSGTWNGETVELYQFETHDKVNTQFFNTTSQPGNASGWSEMCIVENMGMISKGETACAELNKLK